MDTIDLPHPIDEHLWLDDIPATGLNDGTTPRYRTLVESDEATVPVNRRREPLHAGGSWSLGVVAPDE